MKSSQVPVARKEGLVIQETTEEVLVYDLTSNKAHCLNRTAHLIFQTCDGTKTVSEIKGILTPQLGAQVPEEMVWMALDRLGRARLLETVPVAPSGANLARRDALRKLGLATVIALPIVTSIVAPASAQVGSCVASGQMCGAGTSPCCTGTCPGTGAMTCP